MGNIYRYRSNSTLSFKELLYNEIVFSKISELNDPLDAKIRYEFPACRDSWIAFFEYVFNKYGLEFNFNFDEVVRYISKKRHDVESLISELSHNRMLDELGLKEREKHFVLEEIQNWTSAKVYVASFSRDYDHPVMWSHYANSHKGYCLEFEIDDDKMIHHSKTDEILPLFRHSYDFLGLRRVCYAEEFKQINGFMANPYFAEDTTENSQIASCILQAIVTKYEHWSYEAEERMVVLESLRIFQDNHFFPENRIYRYNVLQLRGILFGMHASKMDKHRIMRIIERKRGRIIEQYAKSNMRAIIPPVSFYDTQQQSPSYNLSRYSSLVLDDQNDHKYHCGIDTVMAEYKRKVDSGNYLVIDNKYDPLEAAMRPLV